MELEGFRSRSVPSSGVGERGRRWRGGAGASSFLPFVRAGSDVVRFRFATSPHGPRYCDFHFGIRREQLRFGRSCTSLGRAGLTLGRALNRVIDRLCGIATSPAAFLVRKRRTRLLGSETADLASCCRRYTPFVSISPGRDQGTPIWPSSSVPPGPRSSVRPHAEPHSALPQRRPRSPHVHYGTEPTRPARQRSSSRRPTAGPGRSRRGYSSTTSSCPAAAGRR